MLHYQANITIHDLVDPRAVVIVRRVSDTSIIGTPTVWSARVPLVRHSALTAHEWVHWHLRSLVHLIEP